MIIESSDLPATVVTELRAKETGLDEGRANKDLVRRLFEDLWNHPHCDAAVKYLAPNYTDFAIGPSECVEGQCGMKGPASMEALVGRLRSAFPNVTFHVVQMIAEHDRVAVHFVGAGTHKGQFGTLAPSGKEVDILGSAIHRVVDGKIADSYHFFHIIGLD